MTKLLSRPGVAVLMLAGSVACAAGEAGTEIWTGDCYNQGEPELSGAALAARLRQADAELLAALARHAQPNDLEPAPVDARKSGLGSQAEK